MSSTEKSLLNNNVEDQSEGDIGRKDLQLLLSSRLGAERLVVLRSATSSLLPPGENFACLIYRLDATVRRDENEPEEELHFVIKAFPIAEYVRNVFDFKRLFEKEIFFYERLMPVLRELDAEYPGDEGDRPFDVAPQFYGARRSRDHTAKDVDDGVVVLMENLKIKGYYTLNKVEGLDLNHSRLTIKELARFHALGIACKHHRPHFFKTEVLHHAQVVPFQEDGKVDVFALMYEMMCKDSRIAEYRDRLSRLLDPELKQQYFQYVADEPWLSVVHLDFWTNNILYRRDAEGNLDDVKFIDFQNYSYNSPLRDLPYFLCTSTTYEVMTEHFDELLDLYHETFLRTLRRMKVDVEPYGRKAFDAQLKIDAVLEFFHNLLAIKFFCAEIDKNTYDPSQLQSVVICSQINQTGYDKWYNIVLTYVKRGWL